MTDQFLSDLAASYTQEDNSLPTEYSYLEDYDSEQTLSLMKNWPNDENHGLMNGLLKEYSSRVVELSDHKITLWFEEFGTDEFETLNYIDEDIRNGLEMKPKKTLKQGLVIEVKIELF